MDKIMTKNSELFNECIRFYNVHFHAKNQKKQKISIASIKNQKSKKSQSQALSNIYSHKVRLFRIWPVSISISVKLLSARDLTNKHHVHFARPTLALAGMLYKHVINRCTNYFNVTPGITNFVACTASRALSCSCYTPT